jgi:small subunit ribosomal protein S14
MAKKSLIYREKKRQKLEKKYHLIRRSLKKEISKIPSLSEKWKIHGKLQSLPRNSAPTRLHRRCFSTGRPRANYRDFGLSGHILREMVQACLLPGATRSSWLVLPLASPSKESRSKASSLPPPRFLLTQPWIHRSYEDHRLARSQVRSRSF